MVYPVTVRNTNHVTRYVSLIRVRDIWPVNTLTDSHHVKAWHMRSLALCVRGGLYFY